MKSHQKEFSIEKMAQTLRVSRSGFYRPQQNTKETCEKDIQKIFKEHKERYGSPGIHAALKRQGIYCSRYKIAKGMKMLWLYAGKKKRNPKTTIPVKGSKDLVLRNFTAKTPMKNGARIFRIFRFEDFLSI